MKTLKFKVIALFLVLCMLAMPILTSCKPGEGVHDDSTTASTTEAPNTDVVLFEGGATEYKLLRPDATDKATGNAATALWKELVKMTDTTGKEFTIRSDMLKRDETIPDNESVILVGYTNRPHSNEVYEGLNYGDYRIRLIGQRVYIAAYTEEAFDEASDKFLEYVNEHTEDGKCVLEASLLIEGSVGGMISTLPALVGKPVSTIHNMGDNCLLVVNTDCEKSDYESYLKNIGAEFTHYTSNEIGDNIFNTYKNDKYLVHTYFMGKTGYIRTTIEPLGSTALAGLESENVYTAVTTPLLTQIGVERENSTDFQNGMCYIYRLSDGRFIIYDGGFTNSNADAVKIANTLIEQAVDKKNIVIAAWFITHAHGDHNGAFRTFVPKYTPNNPNSVFTIQNVIRNTPSDSDSTGASQNVNTNASQAAQEKYLKDRGCNLIKTHPGQVFFFADAKITVIYNLEMFLPRSFEYFNTSTSVSILEIAGQSFAMLGDCSEDGSAIIVKNYTKDDIMCDFVQVAHHGYTGGTTALYQLIDPYYVLWPMGEYNFLRKYKYEARSAYLVTNSTKVKAIYTAGASKFVFELPFDGTNYTKTN